jgi:hypothetical protein
MGNLFNAFSKSILGDILSGLRLWYDLCAALERSFRDKKPQISSLRCREGKFPRALALMINFTV